ncbi:Flavodoxin [Phytophthora megakarya]|uniref:Flavodoxin n=1 Tax=Phytophthora megakarya TaxID=4795 RepID=A0A225WD03_9STRA|nr:Flavodoxin [Phytophthora megakarya]
MTKFLSDWLFTEDLSQKVGAVFVTSGGLSAGEELTMVNLLHSLMIFRMIIVGGERWTSAFGASAIVGEGPFEHVGENSPEQQDFPPVCFPTDPDSIHDIFKDKAIGLGERVATITTQLWCGRSRQN